MIEVVVREAEVEVVTRDAGHEVAVGEGRVGSESLLAHHDEIPAIEGEIVVIVIVDGGIVGSGKGVDRALEGESALGQEVVIDVLLGIEVLLSGTIVPLRRKKHGRRKRRRSEKVKQEHTFRLNKKLVKKVFLFRVGQIVRQEQERRGGMILVLPQREREMRARSEIEIGGVKGLEAEAGIM